MTRYFKASAAFYEAIRAAMDASRGYVKDVTTEHGRAVTTTSFPPAAEAPNTGGMHYLALHPWQYNDMPDAAAMLATHLGINILEVTAEEYQSALPSNPLLPP